MYVPLMMILWIVQRQMGIRNSLVKPDWEGLAGSTMSNRHICILEFPFGLSDVWQNYGRSARVSYLR